MADMVQGQFALLGMPDGPADGGMQSQLCLAVDGDTHQEPEPSGMPGRPYSTWSAASRLAWLWSLDCAVIRNPVPGTERPTPVLLQESGQCQQLTDM